MFQTKFGWVDEKTGIEYATDEELIEAQEENKKEEDKENEETISEPLP